MSLVQINSSEWNILQSADPEHLTTRVKLITEQDIIDDPETTFVPGEMFIEILGEEDEMVLAMSIDDQIGLRDILNKLHPIASTDVIVQKDY